MKLYKVENHPDLVKDMESKAVLNNNFAALSEYRKKQQKIIRKKQQKVGGNIFLA